MTVEFWYLIGAALVFWMQAGFAMVETGFTRAKNANNISLAVLSRLDPLHAGANQLAVYPPEYFARIGASFYCRDDCGCAPVILLDVVSAAGYGAHISVPERAQNSKLMAVVGQSHGFNTGRSQKAARSVLPFVNGTVIVIIVLTEFVVDVLVHVLSRFSARVVIIVPVIRTAHIRYLLSFSKFSLPQIAVNVNTTKCGMLSSTVIVR